MRNFWVLLNLVILSIIASGCNGNESLTPLVSALDQIMGYGSVDAHFCTSAPSPGKMKIKYLFLVDHSSSNKPGFPPAVCGAGQILVTNVVPNACWALCGNMTSQATDPSSNQCVNATTDINNTDANGARRYGPMVNFIQSMTPDPNNLTYFGLIDFSDTAQLAQQSTGFDNSSTNYISNTVDPDWIGTGSQAAPSPSDSGFTDYDAALTLAASVIRDDAQVEAATQSNPITLSQYVIVLVTDGEPTIATPNSPLPTCTESMNGLGCGSNTLKGDIDAIMALKNDPNLGPYISTLTLNTAYYFNNQSDPNAVSLLQQMASEGNGQYMAFASGNQVLYQQFVPPARSIVNQLADVFVQNVNGVWWDDGRFMTDTDGDGLPDLIEIQYGSDPNKVDTDGNGVSDYVEYRLTGMPCKDAKCLPAKRNPYAICDGYSPVTGGNGNVTFANSSNDGLNDCEKFLLGGLVGEFNSNNDLIPDFFASVNTLPIMPGSAGTAQADPFGDGISNYVKLKDGLPIQVSDKSLIDVKTRGTSLTVESQPSPQVTCYHYQVNNVALSASQNLIKVMVIQNDSTLQDRPFLMTAEKPVDGNGVASFNPGDFH